MGADYRGVDSELFFVPERCFYQNAYQARELAALRDIRKIFITVLFNRTILIQSCTVFDFLQDTIGKSFCKTVRNAGEEQVEQLEKHYLCVNKQGRPLQKQVYRKMLERASNELALSRVYNSGYLRSLYGYMEIVHGKKTVDDIARHIGVTLSPSTRI